MVRIEPCAVRQPVDQEPAELLAEAA